MSKGQRLAFLALAAAIAIAAVVVLGGGDDEEPLRRSTAPAPTATAQSPGEEAAPQDPQPRGRPAPRLLRPGDDTELKVRQGETVRFRVLSDSADEVHVHGYDVLRAVPAGREVTVRFRADIPGIFEIELEGSHQPLGRLRVEP